MQKYPFLIMASFLYSQIIAQRSIDSLVQAEKKFANTSVIGSTKEAFIKFIDSNGIVFDKGAPVNGLDLYTKTERRPGILTWEPEYVEIASSNDFGYTTGPWKFFQNTLKDKPLARGHFVTVWHINNQGEWKFLIDCGITYSIENDTPSSIKRHTTKMKFKDLNAGSLEQAEEKFIKAYSSRGSGAYTSFLSDESRINYNGFIPATNAKERSQLLDSLPHNIHYTIVGYGLSPQKDLGYVYGITHLDNKQEGYLRIWRREKNEWKIAVEVLRFR